MPLDVTLSIALWIFSSTDIELYLPNQEVRELMALMLEIYCSEYTRLQSPKLANILLENRAVKAEFLVLSLLPLIGHQVRIKTTETTPFSRDGDFIVSGQLTRVWKLLVRKLEDHAARATISFSFNGALCHKLIQLDENICDINKYGCYFHEIQGWVDVG